MRVCFKSKEDSKIVKSKIVTNIEGFYSINYVELKGKSRLQNRKSQPKSMDSTYIVLNIYYEVQVLKV
jgi:hypothetical protein